jgi:hypothetical protein
LGGQVATLVDALFAPRAAALALAKAWGRPDVEQLELLLDRGAFWHDSRCGK